MRRLGLDGRMELGEMRHNKRIQMLPRLTPKTHLEPVGAFLIWPV